MVSKRQYIHESWVAPNTFCLRVKIRVLPAERFREAEKHCGLRWLGRLPKRGEREGGLPRHKKRTTNLELRAHVGEELEAATLEMEVKAM